MLNIDFFSYNWATCIFEFLYIVPSSKEKFHSLAYIKFTKTSGGIITGTMNNFIGRE